MKSFIHPRHHGKVYSIVSNKHEKILDSGLLTWEELWKTWERVETPGFLAVKTTASYGVVDVENGQGVYVVHEILEMR